MKLILLSIWIFLLTGLSASAAVSDTVSFNGKWKFKTDLLKKGLEEKWYEDAVNKDGWDNMQVPGNWDLHNQYNDYAGDAWYSYSFKADTAWSNKNVRLVFQSVYNDSEIWLNGNKVGENHLGFLEFSFNISPYLLAGKVNSLVLRVNNVSKRGAIWNWGGIRRPVWLEITNPLRINRVAVMAAPDLKYRQSSLNFKVELGNYSKETANVSYSIDIFYHAKKVYSSGLLPTVSVKGNDSTVAVKNITLSEANTHLWHFDHPELYTARLNLYSGNTLQHSYSDRFGIRKIEIDGLKLRLNGEEIRPVGFNLVPEDRVSGNTLPIERLRSMVDLMKECGANMARMSHMPLPKEFLDYLDEKGIMTFEEVSLWGKDILVDPNHPLPKLWLKKLISQEFNHPSIIGWSVGNEIGSVSNNPLAIGYIKGAIEKAKELDPSRLATYVSNSVQAQTNDAARYADIVMLNSYGNWGSAAEKAHKNVPDKPIFFSEFGENLNNEDPDKSEIDFSKMLREMRNKPYVIGASLWAFNDYRSEYWSPKQAWVTPVSQNRTWGIVNSILQPKKTYYKLRREFLPFNISFNNISSNSKEGISGKFLISSRSWTDFPAYHLKNFKVIIQTLDDQKNALATEKINLPEMEPGTSLKPFSFNISNTALTKGLLIKVVDNLNYTRFDTLIHLYKPQVPKVLAAHTSKNAVRIVFNKVSSAEKYAIKYGVDSLDKETPATINDFVEVLDLKGGKPFKFQLVAYNNEGSSASVQHTFKLNEDELPPIVWGVVGIEKGFAVSYASDPLDYRYEIEYGTESMKYTKRLTLNNKGVLHLFDLKPKQVYFFRMRRIMQWGFASEWTKEFSVTAL